MSRKSAKSRGLMPIIASVIVGTALLACLGCVAISTMTASSPAPEAVATAPTPAQATEAIRPLETPAPTDIPEPMTTVQPSVIPEPAATPVPTSIPPLPLPGTSRDNPVPAETAVRIGDDRVLTIVEAVRPADDIIRRASEINDEPETGQEYLQVRVQVACNKPLNEKCYFDTDEIKAVGADGNIREAEWVIIGIEGQMESGEFFGGSVRSGKMFFIVSKGDRKVVLFHDPWLNGDDVYLALP